MNRLLVFLAAGILAVCTGGGRAVAQIQTDENNQIVWPTFAEAVERADTNGKILLIDVWSAHCPWCKKQQTQVYTLPDLQETIAKYFEIGRINLDNTTDTVSFRGYELTYPELAGGLGATGTPTTVFLESSGAYITRLAGFHSGPDFADVLEFIGSEAFRNTSYEDFLANREK
ncbi:MAG: thioredoxin family protein [Bacteroidetes bacterium CG12_big_fil_rev_8_21_14_0_65_60_17]|nr:MAG: thioredoxin family protein [Bacteroidetes bacterium CG12_big_fil_rev_8_21_14_0_65_60_17]